MPWILLYVGRAAEVLSFSRPDDEQRRYVFDNRLAPLGLGRQHIDALVKATGAKERP